MKPDMPNLFYQRGIFSVSYILMSCMVSSNSDNFHSMRTWDLAHLCTGAFDPHRMYCIGYATGK